MVPADPWKIKIKNIKDITFLLSPPANKLSGYSLVTGVNEVDVIYEI